MGLRILAILLVMGLAAQAASPARLDPRWESRVDEVSQARASFQQRTFRVGQGRLTEALAVIYGDHVDAEIRSAVAYRSSLPAELTPTTHLGLASVVFKVVVDPQMSADEIEGITLTEERLIILGRTEANGVAHPFFARADVLEHELTHAAQSTEGRLPAKVADWAERFQAIHPDHHGAYLLQPRELEVRIAAVVRVAVVASGQSIREPKQFRDWLALLGGAVEGSRSAPLPTATLRKLRAAFPDAFELVALFPRLTDRHAIEQREALLDYCAAIAPALR